uniref:Uncharacterized protein n=1 Tax=Opuntia streptacantha TaxID=393608 RepID=A0A7C9ETC3_OPUST
MFSQFAPGNENYLKTHPVALGSLHFGSHLNLTIPLSSLPSLNCLMILVSAFGNLNCGKNQFEHGHQLQSSLLLLKRITLRNLTQVCHPTLPLDDQMCQSVK